MIDVDEWVKLIRENGGNFTKVAPVVISDLIGYDRERHDIRQDDILEDRETIARILRAAFVSGIDYCERTQSAERIDEAARKCAESEG